MIWAEMVKDPIVTLLEFRGRLIVATTHGLYEIVDDKLVPMKLTYVAPSPNLGWQENEA
jgi:hypothetical protein